MEISMGLQFRHSVIPIFTLIYRQACTHSAQALLIASLALFAHTAFSQWKRVPNPEIRIPISTYTVASTGSSLLVGTYVGTIYRSTDGGASWKKSDSGISTL